MSAGAVEQLRITVRKCARPGRPWCVTVDEDESVWFSTYERAVAFAFHLAELEESKHRLAGVLV